MGFLGFGKKKDEGMAGVERRQYYRITKSAQLQCRDLGTKTNFTLESKDISLGGVRFATSAGGPNLRKGDTLSIRFSLLPEIPAMETIGNIVWINEEKGQYEGGIAFVNMSKEQLKLFGEAIQKLKTGEVSPVPQ